MNARSRISSLLNRRDGEGRRPNLVLVMTDDQGYGDLESYGAPLLSTPNIDGIGERGMRFTQHYAGSPVCTPSRAALLSGAWPPRVDMPNVLGPGQAHGIPQQEKLLQEYLKEAGYRTAMFGKWHLGDPAADMDYHPMRHSFDRWYGIPFSNDYPTIPVYDDYEVVEEIVYPGALTQDAGDGEEQDWLNRSIFEQADAWLGTQDQDTPFFAYIAASQPHEPVASEFEGSRGGPHGSSIEEMDQLMGSILRTLDELGVRDDTCVIFTSDNGPWWVGDTAGLAGRKSETYEGGMRVPFLMEWPQMVRDQGSVYDRPTGHIDVLPTFCAAAGVPLRTDRVIDGRDITPVVRTRQRVDDLDIAYYQGETLNAFRHGDWKLHVRRTSNVTRFTGRVAWSATEDMPQLFDLGQDPNECYDVSARHPEVLADMLERLATFDAEMKADIERNYGDGPPAPRVDVSVQLRERGGGVQLEVRVTNNEPHSLDLDITTAYGSRSFSRVRPGASVSRSFSTRAREIPAGSVTVTVNEGYDVVVDYAAVTRESLRAASGA